MKWYWLVVIAVLVSLPGVLPFFRSDFFHLHDWTHVARLSELDLALQDGHFPVRWSRNLGYGYGMPQFNFYAPLPYYVAEIFHVMGFSLLWSIKLMVITNFLVSFIALFWATKPYFGSLGGLVAGAVFIYSPYRAVDTYVRGAFGELTAITFIGLVLWALVSWLRKQTIQKIVLGALAVAGLVLSHNLVAFLSLPWLFLVGLSGWWLLRKSKTELLSLLVIFGVGVGIASFYAIPALFEKGLTQVDEITTGFSDYHHHFLYLRQFVQSNWGYGGSIFGPDDDISYSLGPVGIVLALIGIGSSLLLRHLKIQQRWLVSISAVLVLVSILLSTFKTQWLWDMIPLMKYIQFPWRYLSVILVFLAVLAGSIGLLLKDCSAQVKVITFLIVLIVLWLFNLNYFRPEKYLTNTESLYFSDAKQIQTRMSEIIPDFLPNTADAELKTPPSVRFGFWPIPESQEAEVDRTHEFLVRARILDPTEFRANINYFPGWKLYVDGKQVTDVLDPQTGHMRVQLVETGEVMISGRLEETKVRMMANWISFISIMICVYLWNIPTTLAVRRKNG